MPINNHPANIDEIWKTSKSWADFYDRLYPESSTTLDMDTDPNINKSRRVDKNGYVTVTVTSQMMKKACA